MVRSALHNAAGRLSGAAAQRGCGSAGIRARRMECEPPLRPQPPRSVLLLAVSIVAVWGLRMGAAHPILRGHETAYRLTLRHTLVHTCRHTFMHMDT